MTLALQTSNNATSSLDAGIDAVVTAFNVAAGEGQRFPTTAGSNYFYVTLQADSGAWEIVKVTTRATDAFSVIERNVDSSTGAAQAFSASDIVSLRPCADIITDIITELNLMNPTNTLTAPAGTKMVFYQAAPPTGWTIDTDPADHLLAVAGGAQAYNAAGGTKAGTWTQPNHVHTMDTHVHTMGTHIHGQTAHLHSTGDHILTEAEMPSHTHQESLGTATTSNPASTPLKGKTVGADVMTTTSAGSDTAHNHGNTGSTDAGNTDATDPGDTNATDPGDTNGGATANTWRPLAALIVIGTKD